MSALSEEPRSVVTRDVVCVAHENRAGLWSCSCVECTALQHDMDALGMGDCTCFDCTPNDWLTEGSSNETSR